MGLRGFPTFGPAVNEVGADISTATPEIKSPVHHVITTASLTTLTPPPAILHNIVGPLYLIADSVFSWTTTGNIARGPGTTLVVGRAYSFIYQKSTGKWYPMGQDS
jgi:hypothetical protein